MGPARIYPWRKMPRSRAPSIAPGTFFVAQPSADCITNMPGFNLRQAQPSGRSQKNDALDRAELSEPSGADRLESGISIGVPQLGPPRQLERLPASVPRHLSGRALS